MEAEGPSLPANYVTILQLKERWLQQQKQQNPPKSNPDSQFNLPPNPEIPNETLPRRRHHHRHGVIPQLKPRVTVHGSGSKTPAHVADNHPKGEKQEHNSDHSDSRLFTKKNASRLPKPRSITDQNPPGGSTPLMEPRPFEEKKHIARRRSGNQEVVREPGVKTPPLAPNADGLSHNDARGDTAAVPAAVPAVKESNVPNVSQGTNRRGGSGRFHGVPRFEPSKPSFGLKKGQGSLVWVKKGESAPN